MTYSVVQNAPPEESVAAAPGPGPFKIASFGKSEMLGLLRRGVAVALGVVGADSSLRLALVGERHGAALDVVALNGDKAHEAGGRLA
jgi:hypothetical protein